MSEKITKAFFGVPEDDASFDLETATAVYEWYQDTPEAEQIMLNALAEEVPRLENYHRGEIKAAIEKRYNERKEILKRVVIEGAISKSMSDTTIEEIAKAVDLIEKARDNEYTVWERQENARRQWRDRSGRFREMGSLNLQPTTINKPIKHEEFNRLTPDKFTPAKKPSNVSNDSMARYQNAYAQIAGVLDNYNYKDVSAVLLWDTPEGQRTMEVLGAKPEDIIAPQDFKDAELRTVRFYALGDDADSPNTYDAMRAMGTSRRVADEGAYQVSQGGASPTRLKQFNNDWEKASQWDESGATRGFKRLGAASEFADSVFGNVDDPRVKAAIAAGKWAGQYGPEAEKVIGPSARKSAYRYRGVERKPDPKMLNAYNSAVRTATTPTDARTRLIYPRVSEQVVGRGQNTRTIGVPVESPMINYFRAILPSEDLLHLHTNSGAIAPSQGVIIDSKGQIFTQAVGYGDDHYLPFDLKNLRALKGGEYIRTRTLGGPTTEDVYTGMVSGARAFTVVSHSGVYTVEFADDFRGGRRLNDKSARMVKRYGMLLDSLEAEQVTLTPVPKTRQDELMQRAMGRFPGDDDDSKKKRNDYFEKLKKEEQQNPTPSKAQQEEWARSFLDEKVAAAYDDGQGTELTWKDVRAQALAQTARESGESADYLANEFSTPEGAIVAMGMGEDYATFKDQKLREYVAAQKPLRLNSEGYYYALKALQEQFPYYISNVEYRTWDKTSGQKDQGYVKPRFNRPAAIKTGYWDPSIEGRKEMDIKATDSRTGEQRATGKISADRTNYQNWTARQATKSEPKKEEGEKTTPSTTSPSGTPSAPGGPITPEEKAANRAKLADTLQSTSLQIKPVGEPVRAINNADRVDLAKIYPTLFGQDPSEVRRQYLADPAFAKRVDDEVKAVLKDDRIVLDSEFKENFDSTGVNPTVSFSPGAAQTDKKAWFTFGDDSDATLGGNPEITQGNLTAFVDNSPELMTAMSVAGVSTLGEAGALKKLDKAIQDVADNKVELARAARTGEFERGNYTFTTVDGVGFKNYADAEEHLNRLLKNVAKVRQARRRYDAAGGSGGTKTRVVGFTPPEDTSGGGLQPGPNGTKPLGPNGTVPEPQAMWNKSDDEWLSQFGIKKRLYLRGQ